MKWCCPSPPLQCQQLQKEGNWGSALKKRPGLPSLAGREGREVAETCVLDHWVLRPQVFPQKRHPVPNFLATHSSVLVWKIPWTEEPGHSPWGCRELDTTERLTHTPNFLNYKLAMGPEQGFLRALAMREESFLRAKVSLSGFPEDSALLDLLRI